VVKCIDCAFIDETRSSRGTEFRCGLDNRVVGAYLERECDSFIEKRHIAKHYNGPEIIPIPKEWKKT